MNTAGAASRSVWGRLLAHRAGGVGLAIVLLFAALALASWAGWQDGQWSRVTGARWEAPGALHWFGTNLLGQDIFARAVRSTGQAFTLGLLVAVAAAALGAGLGAVSGWRRHGPWDEVVVWAMGVLDSIPFYLLAAALAFAMGGKALAMYVAMIATFWTPTARLVRAEVTRLQDRDFVLAARAIGLPGWRILLRHVLPNTWHIVLVQATLTFVAAIKTEVILSFLGIGVQNGVSWGLMLAESTQDVLAGHFGNFLAASGFLFVLLIGFNLVADAMQDAMDVRQVGV